MKKSVSTTFTVPIKNLLRIALSCETLFELVSTYRDEIPDLTYDEIKEFLRICIKIKWAILNTIKGDLK